MTAARPSDHYGAIIENPAPKTLIYRNTFDTVDIYLNCLSADKAKLSDNPFVG
ncbi:hypothetical protein NEIFL0001_2029 [Neisseria flavescens SK114]|nr:hypothetical protein NEIFL0001_2029 [Neisseria flavescens SK114]